ncbi:MAG: phosphodiester glycosidase family protein, partial [Clostridiales bacterium]|nr:phosphodiester glycosidase family protein [Clostridiales bacterium]
SELIETPGDTQIGGIAPSTENPYPLISASSYEDENIKITLWDKRTYDTDIHIADIVLSSVEFLKTAFASDSYGRNIKETTSSVAERKNAIFAINGDYYGFRDEGHVLRNGVSYRTTGREDALVLNYDGSFLVANEAGIRKDIISNAWQIWSFGPTLVLDGKAAPDKGDEVSGRSSASNPRTAFGEISPLHYVAIVSDGRDGKNKGLSLQELALELEALGCATAYNLDGGGSSTMYFMGSVINNPTDGRREGERRISDIIYVGYE